jgi:hypothetical protein
MPDSTVRYCALAIHWHGRNSGSPLAADGKIVLFDTADQARDVVQRLGGGRVGSWSLDKETIFLSPLDVEGFNKIEVIRNYDPYDVPNGWRSGFGTYSETHNLDWRWHVHHRDVLKSILAFGDRSAARAFDAEAASTANSAV